MRIFSTILTFSFLLSISCCKKEQEKEQKFYGDFNISGNVFLYDNDICAVGNHTKVINLDKITIDGSYQTYINEVHCVTDKKVYFSYSFFLNENTDNETKIWVLSSVDWDGSNLKELYKGEFSSDTVPYSIVSDREYSHRNGFFYKDKIVLCDTDKVVEYDIRTDCFTEYLSDYSFPEMTYNISVSADKKSVSVVDISRNKEKVLDINYIAENLLGKNPQKCSFYYVQNSDEKIYLYIIYDEASITQSKLYVYEYDYLTNKYSYIFSRYNVFDEYELCVVPKAGKTD